MTRIRSSDAPDRLAETGREPDEAGAILVWFALLTVLLLTMAAFAVDFGAAYASRRALSVDTDAAALVGAKAAADKYGELAPRGGNCEPIETELTSAANTAITAFWADEGLDGTSTMSLACEADNTVLVSVVANTTSSRFFSVVLGSGDLDISVGATAKVDGTTAVGGLRPLAFCLQDLPPDFASAGTVTTVFGRDNCGGIATGNFGLVDLENNAADRDLAVGGPGLGQAVKPWMLDGYPDPVGFPTWFNVQTGGSWGGNNFETLTGKTILVPLMDLEEPDSGVGNGQGATYYGVGVMTIKVISAVAQGNTGTLTWKYVSQSASYEPGGDSCIGDAGCLLNVRLWY